MSLLIFILSLLFAAPSSWAATYWVDNAHGSASDGNACTSETLPCLTIQGGIDKAVQEGAITSGAGDTVFVKNGTGLYTNGFWIYRGGSLGNYFTVKNAPGHTPKIRLSTQTWQESNATLSDLYNRVFPSGASTIGWVWIEGLELYNATICLKADQVDNSVFKNNTMHDCGQGIQVSGYRNTVDGNAIYHNGIWENCTGLLCNQSHGVYMSGTEMNIINNVIWQNQAYGIQCTAYSQPAGLPAYYGGCSNNFYANNTIAYETYRAGMIIGSASSDGPAIVGNRITNNIFFENFQNPGCAAVGCTSTGLDSDLFDAFSDYPTHASMDNNLWYSSLGIGLYQTGRVPTLGTGADANINQPPNFVNAPTSPIPTTPDFHLSTSSTNAIDQGANLGSLGVTTDYEGQIRPQGAAYDIGADEFGSAGLSDISYAFSEGIGSSVADLTGNGNAGTLVGAVSWVSGHSTSAVTFSASDQYVSVPTGVGVDPTLQSMTIALAVRPAVGSEGQARIFFGVQREDARRLFLSRGATWELGIENVALTGSEFSVASVWTHVCLRVNETNNTAQLFINGVGSSSVLSYASFTLPSDFRIGLPDNFGITSAPINDTFDDFRFFPSLQNCQTLYTTWVAGGQPIDETPPAPPQGVTVR